MSMYDIDVPYPAPCDHDAARQEERRRRALKTLTVGDVLAELDDLLADEPAPTKHPCHGSRRGCLIKPEPATAASSSTPGRP